MNQQRSQGQHSNEEAELKSEYSKRLGAKKDEEQARQMEKESQRIKISDGEEIARHSQKPRLEKGG